MIELHKEFSKPRMTNCWIFAFQMLFDNRIKQLLLRLNKCTIHMLVVTKNDNILHLTQFGKYRYWSHPIRFRGIPSIFSKKYLRKNWHITINVR